MRNRISASEARNKRRLSKALDSLAERIGFRVAPGFGDRVIFRELFPMGLTMLDLPQKGIGISLSMSHVAARQEVRELIVTLNLPGVGTETGISTFRPEILTSGARKRSSCAGRRDDLLWLGKWPPDAQH